MNCNTVEPLLKALFYNGHLSAHSGHFVCSQQKILYIHFDFNLNTTGSGH